MLQGFVPIHSPNSKVLILGSAPSVRSAQKQQYYGHEQNAFWPIMADIFSMDIRTYEEKWNLLLSHDIALWDVIKLYERKGSSDAAFVRVVPNDIRLFVETHPSLEKVLFNGKKAQEFYKKLIQYYPSHISFVALPSTSSAYTLSYADKLRQYKEAVL
jgi:TDG/mug DNA glycosylase family protein